MSLIVWTMVGIAVWHPAANPPGVPQALLACPGALGGLGLSYWYGARCGAAQEG